MIRTAIGKALAIGGRFASDRASCSAFALAAAFGLLGNFLAAGVVNAQYYQNTIGALQSPVDIPQTNLTPIQQPFQPPPLAGASLFDPYSTGPGAGAYAPAVPGIQPVPSGSPFPGWTTGTAVPPPNFGQPVAPPPSFGLGNPGFSSQPYGAAPSAFGVPGLPPPTFPSTAMPSGAPNSLYPGGFSAGSTWATSPPAPFRLMSGHRFDWAWIVDSNSDRSLRMNELDVAVHFALPDFFRSGQPLYISPGFGLTLLDGPNSAIGADLPGQVYQGYLDADWHSDPNQIFSIDLGLRVGMFSDFDTNISDSFRILGRGIANFRLTPFTTIKGGVYYLDRNRINLLPAFGLVWMPDPVTRWDFYFPEPKYSHYSTTLGVHDVWCYIGGRYGGGSWTVQREAGGAERVDINDLRLVAGLEWGRSDQIRLGQSVGFAEIGYVFAREVLYRNNTGDNFNPSDALMLRAGLSY